MLGRLPLTLGGRAAVALIVLVIAIEALLTLSIVGARREARAAARDELTRQTASAARASEALLATLRADLAFLASSPQLEVSRERAASLDPLKSRWARLETESTLLLFAQGHPALVTLELIGGDGLSVAVISRRGTTGGVTTEPVLVSTAPRPPEPALTLELPIEGAGTLRAVVDPALLIAAVAPDAGGTLILEQQTGILEQQTGLRPPLHDAVLETIDTRGWQPQVPLVLARREQEGRLIAAVERLADRWRTTVLLNALVMLLGLVAALLAVRSARRAARLVAEREHAAERQRLERQVWLQERLATVGRLAASIAHEINNPLAGLANHLALLEQDLIAGDLEAARLRAPRLRPGIERIAKIVRRALGLAKPGGGDPAPVDLVDLVEETVALLATGEHTGAVRIHDHARPLMVVGERGVLGQLFTNLILNALEFRDQGGVVEVRLSEEDDQAVVSIADRGPGLDAAIAEHLFEPFVSSRGSTGLGLAVCHGIVRAHGGTIRGENRDGGGARFEVRLPRERSQQSPERLREVS